MTTNSTFVDLNGWWDADPAADEEENFEAAREEIEELMDGMDPDSRSEITELLTVDRRVLASWEYIQHVLGVALDKSTKWFDAPDMPISDGSALRPIPAGYDIYQNADYNKVVTILVGDIRHSFTAIAGVLAAEAEFFKPICDNRWACGRTGVIELENHQPESFGIFITWLYTRDSNIAEGLVKIDPVIRGYPGLHIQKLLRKKRWSQLLHCYLLADYIGAPRFANHISDALVITYKNWVEDDTSPKALRETIFEVQQTEKMVVENTTESSPLRIMMNDILSPFLVLKSPEASTSFLQRFRRPTTSQNHLTPGYSAQDALYSAYSHSINSPGAFPGLPSNHPIPPSLQIPAPQYQALTPQLFQTPHPRPWSRLHLGMLRRSNSEKMDMSYTKSEKLKKIWKEPRCKYHMHKEGKESSDEE